MLSNYVKIAFRHLIKHRLYAITNITGLALGLAIFIFNSILVAYETNHDSMFSKRERIFVVGSIFAPTSGEALMEIGSIPTIYGPLFDLEIEGAEQVARSVPGKYLLTTENSHFYEKIRFVDAGFTRIFDFQYIHGDLTAVDDPHGLIVTKTTARKLFGRLDVLGETVYLDHKYPLHVAAVIEDIPVSSHFNSTIPAYGLTAVASFETLVEIGDFFKLEGNWDEFGAVGHATYILLSKKHDRAWLQDQVNAVYERHTPEFKRKYISALKVKPLNEVNTWIWDMWGIPIIESIQLLGLLILIVACINYINLATAQNYGRAREVGLRKTLGASPMQLMAQFIFESLIIAAFAMILAIAAIELLIPAYNSWTGREMSLNYMKVLPWLIFGTIATGLLAGSYPAYLISRLSPIDSLRNRPLKNRKGNFLQSLMITAQFSISISILAMVMVVYFQNQMMREFGNDFPKSRILVLKNFDNEEIRRKYETLRRELESFPGVQSVTFSNSIPYDQGTWELKVTPKQGDTSLSFTIDMVSVGADYMETYDIELLAGRSLDPNIADDVLRNREQLNVVINRLAAEKLGFLAAGNSNESILGKRFHKLTDENNQQPRQYTIVGVVEDLNFSGFFNPLKPMLFFIGPDFYKYASIKASERHLGQTLERIDTSWERVIDNYPVQYEFLDAYFHRIYRIFQSINRVLAAFAGIAFLLALIGLFGLTAFMAERRTREIGIRKVMGANKAHIVRLLVWQFSLPVIWSLLLAVPLTYLASGLYLDFFANRIDFVVPVIILASVIGILSAWIIVAGHALNTAREKPVCSLRYE